MTVQTTIQITDQDLADMLKALADEQPDYVYQAPDEDAKKYRYLRDSAIEKDIVCLYWHGSTNSPGCIIGAALHRFGVTGDQLSMYEGTTAIGLLTRLSYDGVLSVTDDARELAISVQRKQDEGTCWYDAVYDTLDARGLR